MDSNGIEQIRNLPVHEENDVRETLAPLSEKGYWGNEFRDFGKRELSFLMYPYLPTVGMGMLYGGSDINKSTFCRGLSIAIGSNERTYLNFELKPRFGNVLYVSSEDDPNALQAMYFKHFKEEQPRDTNVRFLFDYTLEGIREELELQKANGVEFDLVVLDSMGDMIETDLNSPRVRREMKKFGKLAMNYSTCLLWIHHVSKNAEKRSGSDKSNSFGSVHLEAKCRFAIEMKRAGSFRTLKQTKGNWVADKEKDALHRYKLIPGSLMLEHVSSTANPATKAEVSDRIKSAYEAFKMLINGHDTNSVVQAFRTGEKPFYGRTSGADAGEQTLRERCTEANKVISRLEVEGEQMNIDLHDFRRWFDTAA